MELKNVHCPNCNGSGKFQDWDGYYTRSEVCLNCEGLGFLKLTPEQFKVFEKNRLEEIDRKEKYREESKREAEEFRKKENEIILIVILSVIGAIIILGVIFS